MEIEFARTFLAVAAAGNFVGAAERLHLSQSTVSARVQALETQLGTRLFHRGRGGAQLTPAGRRFLRHAKTLVRTLEQARHDVGLPDHFRGSLTLSGRIALWEGFLPHWVHTVRRRMPDVSLRLEIGFEEGIMQGLIEGSVDIGMMYTPEQRPGLGIEPLFDEVLLLVSSRRDPAWPDTEFVQIDWGAEFHSQFSTAYPETPPPAMIANIGWLGLRYLLDHGGSGYFPLRIVRGLLAEGRLHHVDGAPRFRLPAHVVYPTDRRDHTLQVALHSLRELAAQERSSADETGWRQPG